MTHQCPDCNKTFATALALRGHSRVHAKTFEQSRQNSGKASSESAKARYALNPRHCQCCQTELPFEQIQVNRAAKFCSSACAARFNNRKRGLRSEQTRKAISEGLKSSTRVKRNPLKAEVCGTYTPLYKNRCAHCDSHFLGRTRKKYCSQHADLYGDAGRNAFEFTFNPFDYPDIFSKESLTLIVENGFWSPKNTLGITRDHRCSVNEAIRNGYDPYYIKHPLNCELMGWLDNNKKNTESSISYPELVTLVDRYEGRNIVQ